MYFSSALMKTRKDIFVFPETFVKGITFQFLCTWKLILAANYQTAS